MYNIPNYNFYQQQPIQQPAVPVNLKGRPVASFEEVRAASVDFDGSIFYFPDLANKRIYTKQIGMDGSAILNMYELKEIPATPNMDFQNFITRVEFETVVMQLREVIANNQQTEKKQPIINQF